MTLARDALRSLMFLLPPEAAHEVTLRALESGLVPRQTGADPATLGLSLWGLDFPNPVGIAAGFDKDARVPDRLLAVGFGFAEVGTVTPLPQTGNPKPRVFRLASDKAVINRLGFNNGGHRAALNRLGARTAGGIVGVNIGANKDATDRAADYVLGHDVFAPLASYLTVNISSPNTPGLRDLQAPEQLARLLDRVLEARQRLVARGGPRRPIVVKIAPDIAEADLPAIVGILVERAVDGIAVSNTTLARPGLVRTGVAKEAGGLSGAPLFQRATVMLARVHQLSGGRVPLIGIGGIASGEHAVAKVEAGATLLQLYTGLIYEGPELIGRIKSHLTAWVQREGKTNIGELVGRRSSHWAGQSLE